MAHAEAWLSPSKTGVENLADHMTPGNFGSLSCLFPQANLRCAATNFWTDIVAEGFSLTKLQSVKLILLALAKRIVSRSNNLSDGAQLKLLPRVSVIFSFPRFVSSRDTRTMTQRKSQPLLSLRMIKKPSLNGFSFRCNTENAIISYCVTCTFILIPLCSK